MAGLVPAIPIMGARWLVNRDRRDKPGDNGFECISLIGTSPNSTGRSSNPRPGVLDCPVKPGNDINMVHAR
jgi:hypothetical protein